MKRVFICGTFNFPRGGAASNYIQYFGLALEKCGFDVHVITTKNKEFKEDEYKGLHIDEVEFRNNKLFHYYDFKTGARKMITKKLENHSLNKNDIVIVYSHNYWLHKAVQSYCIMKKIKTGAVVVEFFPRSEFKTNRDYRRYQGLMKEIMPEYDFIFPISSYIEKKFIGGKAKQMVLPIMSDPFEYPYQERKLDHTRRFIFPARGKMKDDLENMVIAIGNVLNGSDQNVEFHFCGVKKQKICSILKLEDEEKLDKRIVVHDWLEYSELIALYMKMDYLLLAREDNEMTRANFPSKVPELMCYGVVPVVSRVGDYTEFYLNKDNSVIMDGCKPEIIVSAIKKCLEMSACQVDELKRNSRKTAVDVFGYMNWVPKIQSFLESINED